jgi:hypothetical protein
MKYASESGGMSTSVHDWKPCPPDRFAKLIHQYTTECGDEHGHGALTMTAMKLDRVSTATIFYMPKKGKRPDAVSSPVLMTVSMIDGKVITFESLKYGVNVPPEGLRDAEGRKRNADGVEIIDTGIKLYTKPATEAMKVQSGDVTFTGTLAAGNVTIGSLTEVPSPRFAGTITKEQDAFSTGLRFPWKMDVTGGKFDGFCITVSCWENKDTHPDDREIMTATYYAMRDAREFFWPINASLVGKYVKIKVRAYRLGEDDSSFSTPLVSSTYYINEQ